MSGGWSLLIHGGAGAIARDALGEAGDRAARAALGRALDAGAARLAAGDAALDAVAAAVMVLEDDPSFNAGRGAALTYDGGIALDAAIMDGRSRAAGAVAQVTEARHPVALARRVMEASPHVLLAGPGADQFGREQGIESAPPGWFVTDARRAQLAALHARAAGDPAGWFDTDMKFGTVGAVARDQAGHLAAATSTGGVTGKRWGRIGDSPLIGAGTFADDRGAAVSATGSGEFFIRAGVAHEIAARVRLAGETVAMATAAALADMRALGGTGGVIAIGRDGAIATRFTTPGMFRGRITADGDRRIAIYGDE